MKIALPKGSTGRVPLRVASTCAKMRKGSPSIGMQFRHQGFKLMMHAGTLKFRGASQLSTKIMKVSSIKPESAQQGSNRLIRMRVTNAELANGPMESRHNIGKQGCPRKSQPCCTSNKQPNSMGSKVTSATGSAPALTISRTKRQQHEPCEQWHDENHSRHHQTSLCPSGKPQQSAPHVLLSKRQSREPFNRNGSCT